MRRRARQYCNKEESGRKKEEELLELAYMHVYARIKYKIRVQVCHSFVTHVNYLPSDTS